MPTAMPAPLISVGTGLSQLTVEQAGRSDTSLSVWRDYLNWPSNKKGSVIHRYRSGGTIATDCRPSNAWWSIAIGLEGLSHLTVEQAGRGDPSISVETGLSQLAVEQAGGGDPSRGLLTRQTLWSHPSYENRPMCTVLPALCISCVVLHAVCHLCTVCPTSIVGRKAYVHDDTCCMSHAHCTSTLSHVECGIK